MHQGASFGFKSFREGLEVLSSFEALKIFSAKIFQSRMRSRDVLRLTEKNCASINRVVPFRHTLSWVSSQKKPSKKSSSESSHSSGRSTVQMRATWTTTPARISTPTRPGTPPRTTTGTPTMRVPVTRITARRCWRRVPHLKTVRPVAAADRRLSPAKSPSNSLVKLASVLLTQT
jgi:hypothetical protein